MANETWLIFANRSSGGCTHISQLDHDSDSGRKWLCLYCAFNNSSCLYTLTSLCVQQCCSLRKMTLLFPCDIWWKGLFLNYFWEAFSALRWKLSQGPETESPNMSPSCRQNFSNALRQNSLEFLLRRTWIDKWDKLLERPKVALSAAEFIANFAKFYFSRRILEMETRQLYDTSISSKECESGDFNNMVTLRYFLLSVAISIHLPRISAEVMSA